MRENYHSNVVIHQAADAIAAINMWVTTIRRHYVSDTSRSQTSPPGVAMG
jgi:hypothetical protein